jgi:two-component system response regulator PilR (NtrC family)
LEREVREGQFRKDHFFRLHVFLSVPPLRERIEDIPNWPDTSRPGSARLERKSAASLREALAAPGVPYPGNVRELENEMERAVTLTDARVDYPSQLSDAIREAAPLQADRERPLRGRLQALERELIETALASLEECIDDRRALQAKPTVAHGAHEEVRSGRV